MFLTFFAEALDVIGIENQDVSLNTPQRTKRETNKEQIQSFTNEERRVAGVSSH